MKAPSDLFYCREEPLCYLSVWTKATLALSSPPPFHPSGSWERGLFYRRIASLRHAGRWPDDIFVYVMQRTGAALFTNICTVASGPWKVNGFLLFVIIATIICVTHVLSGGVGKDYFNGNKWRAFHRHFWVLTCSDQFWCRWVLGTAPEYSLRFNQENTS